jgi:hypothetical protein
VRRALTVSLLSFALGACASGGGIDMRRTGDGGPMDAFAVDGGPLADTGPRDAPSIDAPGADANADPCGAGDTRFCVASCGTMGTSSCVAGFFGPCTPPAEDCNNADDDCDGAVDEDIAARMCSSSCGGGLERCMTGRWMGCSAVSPMAEVCNNADEDCDSRVDEMLTRGCSTACGMGTETCSAGTYIGCTAASPRAETCNGADDDCDTRTDESLTRTCMNACGTAGSETCSGGAYGACSAPAVPTETCNGVDDDCNGMVDDGLQLRIFDSVAITGAGNPLTYQPACTGPGGGIDVCLTAAKRWCGARPGSCSVGGAGFLQGTPSGVRIACFGNHAVERAIPWADFAGPGYDHPELNESMAGSRVVVAMTNRWCRNHGFEAGVGPTEHNATEMYAYCLPADMAASVNVATLDLILAASCDPTVYPDDFDCNAASDTVCRDRGYRGGWGPVEWNDIDSQVVCFR